MKAVWLIFVLVCLVAANTKQNDIQKTETREKNIQNKHNVLKDSSVYNTEKNAVSKHHIQKVQKKEDTNQNVNQKTEITEKHVQNEHHDLKDSSVYNTEKDAVSKQHIQKVQKKEDTNENVIQKRKITEKHVQNKHHDLIDSSVYKREKKAKSKQHIQEVQKKQDTKDQFNTQNQNHNKIKEHQHFKVHHTIHGKIDETEHKPTQQKQHNIVSKQHLALKKRQDVKQHHNVQEHYAGKQHRSEHTQQVSKDHPVNRKRHYYHRHMLLKSQSIHKLRNTDVDVEEFENEIVGMLKGIELGKINVTTIVVLNHYVDVIFDHLRKIIMKQELNTVPLPKEKVKVKHAGHCDLDHGTLKDIATTYRTKDAFISYNPTEKKVTLGFPFKFSDLKIHYDFHVKSRLFKTHGGINGFIKNAQFNPVFSYYYKSDKLTLDHFDMKNTGQLTVKFSGHKIVDWIINPVSKAFTHIFHHKIVNTLQSHVSSAIQKGIGKLNQNIAKKMHKL